MKVVRSGLDIAKSVFQIHGVDQHGKSVLKKTLSRGEMLTFFANTPVSLIGIEACAGSHYWARELIKLGHAARLMAARFVTARVIKGSVPFFPDRHRSLCRFALLGARSDQIGPCCPTDGGPVRYSEGNKG